MKCSRCGKEMTSPEGETIIGVTLSLVVIDSQSERLKEHAKAQFGKYYKEDGETKYSFCYECWLDSLFGK